MANVQISEELFFKIFRYHCLFDFGEPDDLAELSAEISKEVENKLDAMATRHLYSKYKTAATPEEREKARQEYLDKKGIGKNFRW